MIRTINGGRYMVVNGGMPATTYVNSYTGAMCLGDMRFNTSTQNIEVYDGNSWIQLNMSHAQVNLTPDAETALDWAIKKATEDAELEKLAKTNPTIADLVNQKKEIDQKIKVVQTLIKDEVKIGSN
jgi:hypothetical protein